ncbi:MAG: ETC complex I subunit [Parvibaculum sp.]|nr:ETC complex I subunit [Parvibaculum sp.]
MSSSRRSGAFRHLVTIGDSVVISCKFVSFGAIRTNIDDVPHKLTGTGFEGFKLARARIYKPAKTAMQSGRAKTKKWLLDFEPASARQIEPLMGWTSSRDTKAQVRLRFDTREEAIAYAEKHGIDYEVFEPNIQRRAIKAYADNFKFGRKELWTH